MNPSSNHILNKLNKNTKKTITNQDIQQLANRVKPTTMNSPQQLKQLVRSVGQMAGVKVPEKTVNEIVKMVQDGALQSGQMDQMLKKIMNQTK